MNNEYLIQKETLTGLADEIRVLSGATAPISTEEMTSSVADANDEVSAQAVQIAEIAALLDGKGVPSLYETCTVHVKSTKGGSLNLVYYALEDNVPVCKAFCSAIPFDTDYEVVVGSYIVFGARCIDSTYIPMTITGNITCINSSTLSVQPAKSAGYVFLVNGNGTITSTVE